MATDTKKYTEAVGRRKTSVARVRITPGAKNQITVNDRAMHEYFPTAELQSRINDVIKVAETSEKLSVSAHVNGGGVSSQADAVAHGLARALVLQDRTVKAAIKKAGKLTRDSREKERRKFGLKKARKAPQWSKR